MIMRITVIVHWPSSCLYLDKESGDLTFVKILLYEGCLSKWWTFVIKLDCLTGII